MYCGVVEVPKKKLEDVLHAAKQLQVKGLFNSANIGTNLSSMSSPNGMQNDDQAMFDQNCNKDVRAREEPNIESDCEQNLAKKLSPSNVSHVDNKELKIELLKGNTIIKKVSQVNKYVSNVSKPLPFFLPRVLKIQRTNKAIYLILMW